MMQFARFVVTLVIAVSGSATDSLAQSPDYAFVGVDDVVQGRLAYLLTLLSNHTSARAVVAGNSALSDITRRKDTALRSALTDCKQSTRCVVGAMILSESDIAVAADVLARMAKPGGALNDLVQRHIRPSGVFQRHAALDDDDLMRAAWLETAAGINRLYRVYALGETPRYPAIDSMILETEGDPFRSIVLAFLDAAADEADEYTLFFDAWSRVGLDLLLTSQRDESTRYEPLASGENRTALVRAASLNWRKYTYSAILVPGQGLLAEERGLAAVGSARLRIAARRYLRGAAPFLIVSGGHVHPDRTPFNEAIEMKRELTKRYGIPESAIFIDPYARHTTTNLRNAVRLIYRAGAPIEMPMLVTTTREQSAYIESPGFGERCERELGYRPHSVLDRLSPNDLVIRLNITSLHLDPRDPLDP